MSQIGEKLESQKKLLGDYYYLFLLQWKTGCRISEALNIQAEDCEESGVILIKGLKGSSDRAVNISEMKPVIKKAKRRNMPLFFSMNRFTAYRLLKKMGIQKLKKGRQRESVTHIFRDEHAKSIRKVKGSAKVIGNALGHKSLKNTDFYGKD